MLNEVIERLRVIFVTVAVLTAAWMAVVCSTMLLVLTSLACFRLGQHVIQGLFP